MRKHCSKVCMFHPCLATESTNSSRIRTIMTTALHWQFSQTELTFWITFVTLKHFSFNNYNLRHFVTET